MNQTRSIADFFPRRSLVVACAGLLALMGIVACSSSTADSTVNVTGTNSGCTPSDNALTAGTIGFKFTNKADDVSELYVLRKNGDVVSEVENVSTGTSRTLTVDLAAGDYSLRCRPGQSGKGITTAFSVSGKGGKAIASPDREITFDAVDFHYEQLDLSGIHVGETIRFVMKNTGTRPHEFEVLGPDKKAIGEVAGVDPGGSGGATVTFTAAGTHTYQCILIDGQSHKSHADLGMVGTFEVTPD